MSKLTPAQADMLERATNWGTVSATGQSIRTGSALVKLGLLNRIDYRWVPASRKGYVTFQVTYILAKDISS